MNTLFTRFTKTFCLLVALAIGISTTGCASGGYKLTRQYARFVNSQNILIRIVLYIFTSVVFVATLIIDSVIFNTMDFWKGTVSQGDYQFSEGDKTFFVKHTVDQNNLRKSVITVKSALGESLQEVVLHEVAASNINVYVDGQLKTSISNINEFPIAKHFDTAGKETHQEAVLLGGNLVAQK